MNPEIKEKWIEALRSKKYKKGKEQLRLRTGMGEYAYCCLGILTHLYCQEEKVNFVELTEDGKRTHLPIRVLQWAELPYTDPIVNYSPKFRKKFKVKDTYRVTTLSCLNDNYESTFEDIAEVIDQYL